MKRLFAAGVALGFVMWGVSPVLAQAPAVPAAPGTPTAVQVQQKPDATAAIPARPPARPTAIAATHDQEFTLTGKIVVKMVALVDSDGREIYLPPPRRDSPETAAIDPKTFAGKSVTVVCKGKEGKVDPRTGKKNLMITVLESIKEGVAPEPAKPATDKPVAKTP